MVRQLTNHIITNMSLIENEFFSISILGILGSLINYKQVAILELPFLCSLQVPSSESVFIYINTLDVLKINKNFIDFMKLNPFLLDRNEFLKLATLLRKQEMNPYIFPDLLCIHPKRPSVEISEILKKHYIYKFYLHSHNLTVQWPHTISSGLAHHLLLNEIDNDILKLRILSKNPPLKYLSLWEKYACLDSKTDGYISKFTCNFPSYCFSNVEVSPLMSKPFIKPIDILLENEELMKVPNLFIDSFKISINSSLHTNLSNLYDSSTIEEILVSIDLNSSTYETNKINNVLEEIKLNKSQLNKLNNLAKKTQIEMINSVWNLK